MKKRYNVKSDLKPPRAFIQRHAVVKHWHEVNPLPLINPRLRQVTEELLADLLYVDYAPRTPFAIFTMLLNFWNYEAKCGSYSRPELASRIIAAQKYGFKLDYEFRKQNCIEDRLLLALGAPKDCLE